MQHQLLDAAACAIYTNAWQSQESRRKRAENSGHPVDTENVERVIVLHGWFDESYKEVAHNGRSKTDDQRTLDVDEAGCGGDPDKTCDNARNHSENRRFAVANHLDDRPGQARHSSSDLGRDESLNCLWGCSEGASTVESEPSEPQQTGP